MQTSLHLRSIICAAKKHLSLLFFHCFKSVKHVFVGEKQWTLLFNKDLYVTLV